MLIFESDLCARDHSFNHLKNTAIKIINYIHSNTFSDVILNVLRET